MALNDNAVVTAAVGYVFTNTTLGAAAPTPSELDTIDPLRFGCQVQKVRVTGSPTTYTLTVGGQATSALPLASTPAQVQTALEALSTVGSGNVVVEGTDITDTDGFSVTWIGSKSGQAMAITGTGTGGTSPAVVVTVTTAPNGWVNIGHTSRDDMPEFGYDGGDTKMKGTWQKKRLREIEDGDPVADSVTVKLEQFDKTALELYYGEDAANTPGVFGVSGDFVPVERSFLVIIVDGDARLGFYASKASIKRDDSIDLPVDDFAGLPIKATFLNHGANRLFDWISLDLFS